MNKSKNERRKENSTFSERIGLSPIKKIQRNSMDKPLRNGLWNALDVYCWDRLKKSRKWIYTDTAELVTPLWCGFFNETLDTRPKYSQKLLDIIRAEYFAWPWKRVYDFLEFVLRNDENLEKNSFMQFCNIVLEEEKSAYRFVGDLVTPITDEVEAESIETALRRTSPLSGVNAHLGEALAKLSDRDKPDYRNSIKESISAVEALLQIIASESGAKFSDALNAVGQKIQLHKALAEALSHLYGYTSNEKGIRHGMQKELSQTFGGAKFMHVLCTAFVNYLIIRCEEEGIVLAENQKR